MIPDLAEEITESLKIPTIGIGAGVKCAGQVLVISDMIGLFEEFRPRFVRTYANMAEIIRKAVTSYIDDVREGRFPNESESYGG
jgi:3-methyl-2-oxobutanoate hydroxymethyltransferase